MIDAAIQITCPATLEATLEAAFSGNSAGSGSELAGWAARDRQAVGNA
jgi:hypothetical protein